MRTVGATNKASAELRRKIIGTALACFSELGFTRTTMEDIRQRAGVSNGSLYHHFRSKGALAAAVYLQGIIDYQDGLLAALEKQREARDGITAIVKHHLQWVTRQKEWANYLTRMRHAEFIADVEPLITGRNSSFLSAFRNWFEPHIASGAVRPVPFDLLIPLMIGPCQEFTRLLLEGKVRTGINTATTELAEAAWLAIRGETPA
jgi:AcrR family transcriptional regulator